MSSNEQHTARSNEQHTARLSDTANCALCVTGVGFVSIGAVREIDQYLLK